MLLAGWCRLRYAVRGFRIDRTAGLVILDEVTEPRDPAAWEADLARWSTRRLGDRTGSASDRSTQSHWSTAMPRSTPSSPDAATTSPRSRSCRRERPCTPRARVAELVPGPSGGADAHAAPSRW
ncbi:transcriptional regulator [Curtobacterium sp. ER1/6]|nr:transcriptional regulator [Curtobacterium sp. ER1/6]